MTNTVTDISRFLGDIAPLHIAAEWDNVGLLVGSGDRPVRSIMTCLTVTPASVAEAVDEGVDMIVTHHPLLFRGVKRITSANVEGRMLMQLIKAEIAVFSAHTAFDNATTGINQQIADHLGLESVLPLRIKPGTAPGQGEGRVGAFKAPQKLRHCTEVMKRALGCQHVSICGDLDRAVKKAAIACGAGGEFVRDAIAVGADLLITGEMRFHDALLAEASGVAVVLPGHYATERFAMEQLVKQLTGRFAGIKVWASKREADPFYIV